MQPETEHFLAGETEEHLGRGIRVDALPAQIESEDGLGVCGDQQLQSNVTVGECCRCRVLLRQIAEARDPVKRVEFAVPHADDASFA